MADSVRAAQDAALQQQAILAQQQAAALQNAKNSVRPRNAAAVAQRFNVPVQRAQVAMKLAAHRRRQGKSISLAQAVATVSKAQKTAQTQRNQRASAQAFGSQRGQSGFVQDNMKRALAFTGAASASGATAAAAYQESLNRTATDPGAGPVLPPPSAPLKSTAQTQKNIMSFRAKSADVVALSDLRWSDMPDNGKWTSQFINYLMGQKRINHAWVLMKAKQMIEQNMFDAMIKEMTTQKNLVEASVLANRVQEQGGMTQGLADIPIKEGAEANQGLANQNPTLNQEQASLLPTQEKQQILGPVADELGQYMVGKLANLKEDKLNIRKSDLEADEKEEYQGAYYDKYKFNAAEERIINEWNEKEKNNPRNRVLLERFAGDDKPALPLQFLSGREVKVLEKMDEFGAARGVKTNFRDRYMGSRKNHIQGAIEHFQSNHREDGMGKVGRRMRDRNIRLQAAEEARARATEYREGKLEPGLSPDEREAKAVDCEKHAQLHEEDALGQADWSRDQFVEEAAKAHKSGDHERGKELDALARESNNMLADSLGDQLAQVNYQLSRMERKPGMLQNQQAIRLKGFSDAYNSMIEGIERKLPGLRLDKNNPHAYALQLAMLDDLNMRVALLNEALLRPITPRVHQSSAAAKELKDINDLIYAADEEKKRLKLPAGSEEAKKLDRRIATLKETHATIAQQFRPLDALDGHAKRFKTGQTQYLYEEFLMRKEAAEAVPDQETRALEMKYIHQEELEMKAGGHEHQFQACELYKLFVNDPNKAKEAVEAGKFPQLTREVMQAHMESMSKYNKPLIQELKERPDRTDADNRRLSLLTQLKDSADDNIGFFKKSGLFNKAGEGAGWNWPQAPKQDRPPVPKRTKAATIAGAPNLGTALPLIPHTVNVPTGRKVTNAAGEKVAETVAMEVKLPATPEEVAEVREEMMAKGAKDPFKVDYTNQEDLRRHFAAKARGSRFALEGYHDEAQEGQVWNLQLWNSLVGNLQDSLKTIQDYTEGDAQNASSGASSLSSEVMSLVRNAFEQDYDKQVRGLNQQLIQATYPMPNF